MNEEREKSLERQMRAFHWVRLLAELPGRLAGTSEEREAAERVEAWLREIGIDEVSSQPARARPHPAWVAGLHLAVGALACAFGGALGVVIAGFAAYSFSRELRARDSLFSRWLTSTHSLNVIGRAGSDAPTQRVVLCAELDARQPGWIFSEFLAAWNARRVDPARASRTTRSPAAVAEILLWSAVAAVLARWLGASGFLLAAGTLLLGLALAAGALVSLLQARPANAPGANDNASGVSAMLTAAEQLLALLPRGVELWVVASGAGGADCSGMRAFVDSHRDWSPENTLFIHYRSVGGGALHYIEREGPLGDTAYVSQLAELARRVSASGLFGEVTPVDWPEDTEGGVAVRAGFQALSLISLEADGLPRNQRLASDLPASLDMEAVIRASDFGVAVTRAALRGEAGPIAIL
ncbi:MAG: M28 family peptidase [Deltaproteobacteria bacterium]|nr:M28 family peptidase [Deltaproteobacteria bacterium]